MAHIDRGAVARLHGGAALLCLLGTVACSSEASSDAAPGSGATAGVGGASGAAGASGSAGSGGAGGTTAPDCPGKVGAPGLTPQTVTVGSAQRTFLVYVPANVDPTKPTPLVFAHHGYTDTGDGMRTLTNFDTLADQEGFIVVFPDGAGQTWNAGVGVCGFGSFVSGATDDFGFVEAMVSSLDAYQCVDHTRVFTTGFSMGGYFSNHIGCKRPDLNRAIGPHSGGGPPAGCVEGHKPVFLMHGAADPLIVTSCGVKARDTWVTHNGCSTEVENRPVKGGHCEWSRGCPADGQVVLCLFDGMQHDWAGSSGVEQYEDATKLVWDFFKSQ